MKRREPEAVDARTQVACNAMMEQALETRKAARCAGLATGSELALCTPFIADNGKT